MRVGCHNPRMDTPSSRRTYLVTGANRGLGLEFARQLAARGDTVLATARDRARAGDLAATKARVFALDAADERSIAALPAALANQPIDVLINNAGVSADDKSIAQATGKEMETVFRVNAFAPVLVSNALLANLRAGRRRLIVNITSQLGSLTNYTGGWSYAYCASKAALNMFTRAMAAELKNDGITCVALHPGWVQTDMGGPNAPLQPEESVRSMLKVIDSLGAASSGRFLNYDGKPIDW
jgi:NAD(P)-dependent dehydrogenase (short-subunit alcohol dehydrogenase family)